MDYKTERCTTNWYVTTSRKNAERLAKIDNTPLEKIKCVPVVEPLCVDEWWSYWSDGKFIGNTFDSISNRSNWGKCPISDDAKGLLDEIFGSDIGNVEGGLKSLITIEDIISERDEIIRGGSYYAPDRIKILEVKHKDGKEETLYIRTKGYFEGYAFDIYRNYNNARNGI